MASTRRVADLRTSLMRQLDEVSRLEGFDGTGRRRWLRGELENYLDRWLAFAAVEAISLQSLLNDDLFAMVLVAADAYEREVEAGGSEIEEWRRFSAALSRIRVAKDRATLGGLREALDAVGAALGSTRTTGPKTEGLDG